MGLVAQPHQIAMYQLCQVEVGVIADEGAGFFERFGNLCPLDQGKNFYQPGFGISRLHMGQLKQLRSRCFFCGHGQCRCIGKVALTLVDGRANCRGGGGGRLAGGIRCCCRLHDARLVPTLITQYGGNQNHCR